MFNLEWVWVWWKGIRVCEYECVRDDDDSKMPRYLGHACQNVSLGFSLFLRFPINNSWKIHLYIVSFSYCTNYLLLLIFLCFLLYYDLWSFLFLYMTTEACCSIVVTVGNENPNLQSNEWKVMKIMHAKGKLLGLLSVYIDVCEYCLLGKRKRFSFWTSSQVEPLPYGNLPILLWCLRVAPLNITLNPQSKA